MHTKPSIGRFDLRKVNCSGWVIAAVMPSYPRVLGLPLFGVDTLLCLARTVRRNGHLRALIALAPG